MSSTAKPFLCLTFSGLLGSCRAPLARIAAARSYLASVSKFPPYRRLYHSYTTATSTLKSGFLERLETSVLPNVTFLSVFRPNPNALIFFFFRDRSPLGFELFFLHDTPPRPHLREESPRHKACPRGRRQGRNSGHARSARSAVGKKEGGRDERSRARDERHFHQ